MLVTAATERALPGETERRNPNHHRAMLAVTTAFWDAYLLNDKQARQWLDSDAVTLRVGDMDRRYRVYIPKKYDASKATPVVVVFHGGGGNPESMIRLAGMNAKVDEAGFLVVYPFGTSNFSDTLLTFNGGECCGYAMQNKVDDVGFTRELLDDLTKVASVDQDRVFATSLSNGGIMSPYVASELSDRIAAIAPVGGPLMMEAPHNTRPVPVMHFHGTADAYPGSVPAPVALSPGWLAKGIGPEHSGLYKFRIKASGIRPPDGQSAHLGIGKMGEGEQPLGDFQSGIDGQMAASETNMEHEYGTVRHSLVALSGPILDVMKQGKNIPLGSSGIQIRMKVDQIMEGIRPGRIVRIRPMNWPDDAVSREEYTNGHLEERFPDSIHATEKAALPILLFSGLDTTDREHTARRHVTIRASITTAPITRS